MTIKKFLVGLFGFLTIAWIISCTRKEDISSIGQELRVGMVINGSILDASFNEGAWRGLQKAQKDRLATVSYRETKGPSEYAQSFEAYAENGVLLIFGVGFLLEEASYKASLENHDINFISVDGMGTYPVIPKNFLVAGFDVEQASFLAGYLAGRITYTGKVGFLGGIEGGVISLFDYGFEAGVRYARPDIEFIRQYSHSFTDVAKGHSIAEFMLGQGVDIIFHAAGSSGTGMIEAVKENHLRKGRNLYPVWAIGVDQDQYELAPEVMLTSVLKRVDLMAYELIKKFLKGTFEGGKIEKFGLKGDFVGLSDSGFHHISPELLAEVDLIKKRIENGKIIVPRNAEEMEKFKY